MTGPRQAAVLVPFFRDGAGRLRLVLIERSNRGQHAGQLALPGGNVEPGDADLRATAVRETCEELGVTPDALDVLDALAPSDARTTGYQVWPFVARITPPTGWRPQPSEVATVLEPLVTELAVPSEEAEVTMPQWPQPRRTPVRYVSGRMLWGLTLRILDPVLPRALSGDWPV